MKITRKNEMKITLAIMALFMTCLVSFVSVVVNYGFDTMFFVRWLKAWGIAFIVALPVVLVIVPAIKKVLSRFVVD